jgi:hypothetical protein
MQSMATSRTKIPHEYLRDTLCSRYQECKSCRNRTQLFCIKCGFCYSCHWKQEELEKRKKEKEKEEEIQSKPLITEPGSSYPSTPSSTKTMMMILSGELIQLQPQKQQQHQQQLEQAKVIDVFGQESEPICNYYRCRHKFSFHGLNSHNTCYCKHPKNSIIGISKSIHENS